MFFLLTLLMFQGISRASVADMIPPQIVSQPTLTPNPNPAVPLAAKISVSTNEPTRVELVLKGGNRSWSVLADPTLTNNHIVPVLGVSPNLTYYISVTVRDAAGNWSTWPQQLTFITPPLPDFFPSLQVTVQNPQLQEPGVTLFSATSSRLTDSYLVIVNERGEVIWFYRTPLFVGAAIRIANGNLVFLSGRKQASEIDMFGNEMQTWWAGRIQGGQAPPGATLVDANAFHHDIIELPESEEADFAVMSSELRQYPNYPASEQDPSQTNPLSKVVGDVIVEFRRDGSVVREIPILDVIDPYRISYNSLQDFWNDIYLQGDTEDWTHGNAIVFDPSDQSYVYSARHQEAVVRFRREGLQLQWILGPHQRWPQPWRSFLLEPIIGGAPFAWNYHQHGSKITSKGTILMFDNGNGRAVAPDPELPEGQRFSRAVEYRIHPATKKVEQVWSYGGMPNEWFYSPSLGDADELPLTGNIKVTDGDRDGIGGAGFGRIVELTREHPAIPVFEIYVRDLSPVGPVHWSVYRSEHLGGIYPHQ